MKQILWSLVLVGGLVAQPQPPQGQPLGQPQEQYTDDGGDAPDHGVARISVVVGDVSVRRSDTGELTAAVQNSPIMTGDSLVTGPNARAEVQFDAANMIRVAGSSEVRMGDLQDRRYLVQVAVGTTTYTVLGQNGNAQTEVSTPTVSVHPQQAGAYRVTVHQDGSTEITVRAGQAEIFSPRGSETLRVGQTMQARGDPSDPEYMIGAAIPLDEWDRWNAQRDQALQQVTSSRYVSPDVYGTEELDSNGHWEYEAPYGNVWVPNVAAGWAPYREGRWVDEDYYGWTWVSYDPFGWAPYHYGRWYSGRFGWAWYPGAIGSRYYWRPALVGFFGWGGGGGLGFGFGNVGWVPLAPFERYHPWYGSRFGNTNIFNVNVSSSFRNARFNGVTSVRSDQFGRGRVGSNNFVRASNNDLNRAGSVQGRMPFTATRESRAFSDRQVNTQNLPRVNQNTRFFSRSQSATGNGGNQGGSNTRVGGANNGGGNIGGNTNRGGLTNNGTTNNGAINNGRTNNGGGNPGGNAATNGGGWRRMDGTPNANVTRGQNSAPASRPNVSVQPQQNNVRRGNTGGNNGGGNGNGGWRGFDSAPQNGARGQNNAPSPAVRGNSPAQAPAPQVQRDSGWRGYNGASPAPQPQRAQPNVQRQQSAPQQPVRINPSIVRERAPAPQPSYNRPAPQPSYSRPAPAPSVSQAPRGGGGGGGGGARPAPSGGGGGGNRGGGGGGNRGGGGGGGGGHRR